MMSTNEKIFLTTIPIIILLGITVIPLVEMGYILAAKIVLYTIWGIIVFGLIFLIYNIWTYK